MEAIFTSTLVVTLAEMGDKTQLLAFSLTARYRRPWTILLGILIATVLNHALAASVGGWVAATLGPTVMAWILGISFLAFGVWTLIPDTLDDDQKPSRWGPLVTTTVLFFLAEIGDKTQLATIALGARYQALALVTMGTTAGMLIADGLAVALGSRLPDLVPLHWLRRVAAALFVGLGLLTLAGAMGVDLPFLE